MKRLTDMAGALAGLVALAPLLALLWLAVVVESGLPGFFRQQRAGFRGRYFPLLKFRSMTVLRGTEQGSFEAGSAARVTRVGALLRRTKLDELPQLWNVLIGDMSLVGPRPEVRKWVDAYPERWTRVLAVRPGITDPASLVYRNEEEILARSPDPEKAYRNEILPHKLDLYEEYVRTQSFWGDIRILARTAWVVVRGKT
jgi:lipopolysaccharide/colanic/teichoic acid biosynthesis glycosyltransferase